MAEEKPAEEKPIVVQEYLDENGVPRPIEVRILEGGADQSHLIRDKFKPK